MCSIFLDLTRVHYWKEAFLCSGSETFQRSAKKRKLFSCFLWKRLNEFSTENRNAPICFVLFSMVRTTQFSCTPQLCKSSHNTSMHAFNTKLEVSYSTCSRFDSPLRVNCQFFRFCGMLAYSEVSNWVHWSEKGLLQRQFSACKCLYVLYNVHSWHQGRISPREKPLYPFCSHNCCQVLILNNVTASLSSDCRQVRHNVSSQYCSPVNPGAVLVSYKCQGGFCTVQSTLYVLYRPSNGRWLAPVPTYPSLELAVSCHTRIVTRGTRGKRRGCTLTTCTRKVECSRCPCTSCGCTEVKTTRGSCCKNN